MTSPRNLLLHGTVDPLPEVTVLQAGPLSMIYTEGEIRYVRLAGREVVRRLYVAVRDAGWYTVPARVVKVDKEILPNSFRIDVHLENKLNDIDFYWKNSIVGEVRGRILFKAKGTARSCFLRNRIGLCVLFPAAECQSASCVVTGVDGKNRKGTFPDFIRPDQPFREMSAISFEPFSGALVKLGLRGDIFEMEDQRNWGDASFKIYSTPLELPVPVEVRKGTVVSQSATINLETTKSADISKLWLIDRSEPPVTITFQKKERSILPRIGLGLPTGSPSFNDESVDLLRGLNLSHLRVDLRPDRDNLTATLRHAAHHVNELNLPLECALYLSASYKTELDLLAESIRHLHPSICTVLVFESHSLLTNADHFSLARAALGPILPGAKFGGGTDSNFADLNRCRPSLKDFDLLSFSYNPQIHLTDEHSLIENLDSIRSTILSAKQFAPGVPIAISPVTFKFRYRLDKTPHPPLRSGETDTRTDSRQTSLFGASLSLGILKHLAESGLHSATCFQSFGPQGLLPNDALRSVGAYPLFHVFASTLRHPAAAVIPTKSSSPLTLQALALEHRGEMRVLLGNLSPEKQKIECHDFPFTNPQSKSLDESNLALAIEQPAEFQKLPYLPLSGTAGSISLEIQPWGVTELVCPGLKQ
jgi:hypothetical protein